MWWLKLGSALKKFWPQIAIAGAVVAVLGYVYDLGGDVREANIRSELAEQFAKDVSGLNDKHQAALKAQGESIRREYESRETEKEVIVKTEKVIEYVDKIIVDDSCKRLAVDTIGLLHQSTNIGAESP